MRPVSLRLVAPVLVSLTASASVARANTYTVDAAGGGDFTDLVTAIAAASQGDVLLVKNGGYGGFTLSKRLVIVGEGAGVVILGPAIVENIGTGSSTVLAGMTLLVGGRVSNCSRPIVLDEITSQNRLDVENCIDVRIARSTITEKLVMSWDGYAGLRVDTSRVELNESSSSGADGHDDVSCCIAYGGQGGQGVQVFGTGSDVHVYRSDLQGGDGGDGITTWEPYGESGPPGCGLLLHPGSQALVAGTSVHTLVGGAGGYSTICSCSDSDGWGIDNDGSARVSGVTATIYSSFAYLEVPAPPDPSLYILTTPKGGQTETFRVAAESGSTVQLLMGRNAIVTPFGALEEDLLVLQQRVFNLGVVDASGVVGFNFPISAALPKGFTFFAQAKVTLPGGELRYSNSVPLIVR